MHNVIHIKEDLCKELFPFNATCLYSTAIFMPYIYIVVINRRAIHFFTFYTNKYWRCQEPEQAFVWFFDTQQIPLLHMYVFLKIIYIVFLLTEPGNWSRSSVHPKKQGHLFKTPKKWIVQQEFTWKRFVNFPIIR